MLDHGMAHGAGKATTLHELKNLMIATDGRPRVDVCKYFSETEKKSLSSLLLQTRRFACTLQERVLTGLPLTLFTHMF